MSHSQRQENIKKKKEGHKSEEDEEEDQQDDSYERSFVADDDEISQSYDVPFIPDRSDDEEKGKKSKKEKKRDKKKKKEKKRKREEESYDEDDLQLIDQDRGLTRLKKKKDSRKESDDDQEELEDMVEDDGYVQDELQSDEEDFRHMEEQSDQFSEMHEVVHQQMDIFDPGDLKALTIEEGDRELVETDLPERYIKLTRSIAKNIKQKQADLRQLLQKQDKASEAEWIFNKIRALGYLQSFDERDCRQRIRRVLECLHRQHLDIMYIHYYRKKIFGDYLNLDVLWKIQQFDEEWYIFREKQKKCQNFLESVLPSMISFGEVPSELIDSIRECTQQKYIKYFQDYQQFAQERHFANKDNGKQKNNKKHNKFAFVNQIAEKRVSEQLEKSQIFLSPQNLCYNLKQRAQQRKPKTPSNEPKDEFQKFLKSTNPQSDRLRFPLLAPEFRFKTISKYLCYQLFSYPELRRFLRERYYKKLVITTNPTTKGNQDIDLYSIYFPVKRIKEKPVSTLKREVWILALQAQKKDLIKIQLKFQWQLSTSQKNQRESKDRDPIYLQLAKNYYEFSSHKSIQIWNLFRKRIIQGMLQQYFFPSFMKQIKDDLTRQGEQQIINACCQKLRMQLNKAPSLTAGKPNKILAMVLEDTKLGIAFVDESGKALFTFQINVSNDEDLRRFVGDENLQIYIKQYNPNMILIAANCKRAQTLRKQLRNPDLKTRPSIFCAFGEYQVPHLVAKKKIIQGLIEQEAILEAISMARLKKNPMAEIISLWSDKITENGILSLNLHQYQSFVNQNKLKDSLQKVIIEVVNLVGLDLNQLNKNDHIQNQLQFVSGLGSKKAFALLQKLKEQNTQILNRKVVEQIVKGKIVAKNCTPFLKIQTSFHKNLFQKIEKDKKGNPIKQYEQINLLDMTRIPEEWYGSITKKISENYKSTSLSEMRTRRQMAKLSDDNILLLEIFKNPERIRGIQWKFKDNIYFDQQLVKSQIMSRFKNPRDPQKSMQNKEIFFALLRETPETLKRYMIMPVKVLSIKKNYLNVIIPQNGLFGYIKLQSNKTSQELEKMYEKGTTIKAVIIGFPFDEKANRDNNQQPSSQEQQLLKIEMALDFPHKDNDRHEGSRHDCMVLCFPQIVKEIHPLIDLEKDRFQLRKEDRPVIQVREEKTMSKNIKADFRRISHPKFKNISAIPAIQLMKSQQIGEFVIRPSSQGPEYLTITWNFFKGVIVHIKVRCEHKGMNSMNITYRIQDKQNRSYSSLEQIIEKCIKPMNILVQDVSSNKKFLNTSLQVIQNNVKRDMQADSTHIYYYFGVSEEFPQYFILIYMYKEKKPIRELIKVKSSGLYFHDQQFSNIRDLIAWFKEHLKEKEYQKYVKNSMPMLKK